MDRLVEALNRLDHAVARLAGALAGRAAGQPLAQAARHPAEGEITRRVDAALTRVDEVLGPEK